MTKLDELTSLERIEAFIEENEWSFLYISRPDCNVCHALLPKLKELLDHYPLIRLGHIDASKVEAVAAKFMVFTVPSLLLIIEGKEYMRENRFVRFDRLNEQLEQMYEAYNQ
ncbi:thioredoxin family protein [Paenibacillus mucilaginosus]|uniref:YdfQ n=3 Tax=Paenibacillus mucilaginosus TaxID=61624 RepID=H6NJW9_9BACL|nr:thioredoxin family protein [Paenibacillus mucilaginosus]AEI41767.1 YdfQ [Paenibacillus mucilaginosus KNP414]AFC30273.1 YdfQ [Paenibacillus mucilaginosus 3016]AFH62543.1 thioredoxin [Paenibacillus mucilaginosus K02]MCG7214454.1 thioredoxin family protein [Paenibacillus mucilaginosus]WDM30737.1 thioredoxin family protein [Paenibacillus mucilaginosus]